jgi:tellurite resistance protein
VLNTRIIRSLRDRLLERGAPSLNGDASHVDGSFQTASLDRVAPLAELLFLMMSADGAIDARELSLIRGTVRTLTDGLVHGATTDRLIAGFQKALDHQGLEGRLGTVTARLAADREEAEMGALLAAAVALADDRVDEDEETLFHEITEQLGIGKRRLDELLGEL